MLAGPSLLFLLGSAVALTSPPAPQTFSEIVKGGVTLRHQGMGEDVIEPYLDTLVAARRVFSEGFGLDLPVDPTVTVQIRGGTQRFYFTDGRDQVTLWYPSSGAIYPVGRMDARLLDLILPCFVQLWIFDKLESTAGLDRRIVESFAEYASYVARILTNPEEEFDPPAGPGQVWYHLDDLYGAGTTTFLMHALAHEKVPAHELGALLRRIVVGITEDPQSERLLDLITSPEPLLGRSDLEPGEPLAEGTNLRASRLEIFNGGRILDTGDDPLDEAARFRDFENVYEMLLNSYPTKNTAAAPPEINGVELWQAYFEFRPRIQRARDNVDYYLVLREFLSRFQDRTLGFLSPHGSVQLAGVVGLSLEQADDRLWVSTVTPDSELDRNGVTAGMELIGVDGREITRALTLMEQVQLTFASCSSPIDARARAGNLVLTGAEGSVAELVFQFEEEVDGVLQQRQKTITTSRGSPTPGMGTPKFVDARMDDEIGVLTVHTFQGNALSQFVAGLRELREQGAKSLVVDLRSNEGGDPRNVLMAFGLFLQEPTSVAFLQYRKAGSPPGTLEVQPIRTGPIPGQKSWTGPACVLTDAWTSGPSELFALGFQVANRGSVLGQTTAGAVNGAVQPVQPWQTLSATGVTLSFTRNAVLKLDGLPLDGNGVIPDHKCETSPDQLATGTDGVLEQARKILAED